MSKKSFKIARKPGERNSGQINSTPETMRKDRERNATPRTTVDTNNIGLTTRKTIEVPEGYFFRVKMRALERNMLEKELWAEILAEYFDNHPTV